MRRRERACILDTNVLLRHLLADDPDQSTRAHRLMRQLQADTRQAELSDVVIAETVWVLEKGLGVPRRQISAQLGALLSMPGLRHAAKHVAREALDTYAQTRCDIVDCLLASRARARDLEVCSFDADFETLGCAWREP